MAGERSLDNETPGKVQSDKKYRCQHCRYATNNRSTMYTHQHTHFGVKPYKCEFCEKRFGQSGHLKRHVIALHKKTARFSCPDCTYTAKFSYNLKEHSRIHSEVKPYACQVCDFTTKHQSAFHVHMARHTGTKKHSCPHCEYSFIATSDLKRHIATHTGVKNHKCPHCDYSCIPSGNMKRHIKARHCGVEKHVCPHCEFSSLTLADFQAHSCPPGDPLFSCAQCGAQYVTQRALDIHALSHEHK